MGRESKRTALAKCGTFAFVIVLLTLGVVLTLAPPASAQSTPTSRSEPVSIRGTVRDSQGKPIGGAFVHLERDGVPGGAETTTNAAGEFAFSHLLIASYQVSAEKSGSRSLPTKVVVTLSKFYPTVDLILQEGATDTGAQTPTASGQTMEFADKPNFSVAGVTDWTAVGGHGSDSTLRTSEALAGETSRLKPTDAEGAAPSSAGAAHRVAGELAEKQGDPLAAVREFEQAVRLDPSEENYFLWGSELLLHRAVWQAEQVLHQGTALYPKSARMLTGLGAALFAGARYEEAAARLCTASDLTPNDPNPYLFLGRIQIAAPDPLPCVEQKLARFVQLAPTNSLANYFYAMALLKRQKQPADRLATEQAEALLIKATTLDNKCSDAYLELGILSADRRDYPAAIQFYSESIGANPLLSDAHYRLGVAYDRIGEPVKAKQEFELHDQLKQKEAAEIERQRLEVKQFVVVQPGQPNFSSAH